MAEIWSRAWREEESPGKFCISVQGDPLPGPPDNRKDLGLKDDFSQLPQDKRFRFPLTSRFGFVCLF